MLVMKSTSVFVLLLTTISHIEVTPLGNEHHPRDIRYFLGDGDDAEVRFLLSTKNNVESPLVSKIDDDGMLFNGTFDNTKTTKILIHGWLDTWKKEFAQLTLTSFLPQNDYNIIIVDWMEADNFIYPIARYKVTPVGKITARFIERMINEYGLDVTSLHVIGHSLGAQVAAVAGYNLGSNLIGRITGLDPAYPLFSVGGQDTLSTKAASFVEVVHTCGGVLGIFVAIGHVDFYPNGGTPFQPGCTLDLKCSHVRSFKLYAESIVNKTAFVGTECSDWTTYENDVCKNNKKLVLNGDIDFRARGKYFFKTASTSPYGLGPDS